MMRCVRSVTGDGFWREEGASTNAEVLALWKLPCLRTRQAHTRLTYLGQVVAKAPEALHKALVLEAAVNDEAWLRRTLDDLRWYCGMMEKRYPESKWPSLQDFPVEDKAAWKSIFEWVTQQGHAWKTRVKRCTQMRLAQEEIALELRSWQKSYWNMLTSHGVWVQPPEEQAVMWQLRLF